MHVILILIITSLGYYIAYHTYGRYLATKIFQINPERPVPSISKADGKEYVASDKQVMFGHHFTSIAGTGPIVGPAIGVIWGWLPALLWVFFGSILMGAVHDFSVLVISMRNEGKSIAEIADKYCNKRVQLMFFIIVFLALLIVIAIFGLVIAIIFAKFPQSVIPVWAEIPIAIALSFAVFKKGKSLQKGTLIAVIIMAITVGVGAFFPIQMPAISGVPMTGVWTIILLTYAYFASILPVQILLQPRDYINAWQLYISLGLIVLGLVLTALVNGMPMPAPMINPDPVGAPSMWPFLFITIACGAISGFHSLVCSGTSSKQIKSESDAQYVGYGAMLTEAFLATVMIIAVTAGLGLSYITKTGATLTGKAAWLTHYGSWTASSGLGSKLDAVVVGCSNMMSILGISPFIGITIVGVFIASFAGTTLDSATRVQRYVITEFMGVTGMKKWANKWLATGLAVVSAALLAFSSGANGKGALLLWPMFGAVNQLLGGLALMIATAYLHKKGGVKWLVTAIPCVGLMSMTLWASILNQVKFNTSNNIVVGSLNLIIMGLAMIISVEILIIVTKKA